MRAFLYSSIILLIALSSCSSPAGDGRQAAKNENHCAEKCLDAVRKLDSDFVDHFDSGRYTYRSQAVESYWTQYKKIMDDYESSLDVVRSKNKELQGRYSSKNNQQEKFDTAYGKEKDASLSEAVQELIELEELPQAVLASINRIIPPKPDENQIKADLVGHQLNEAALAKDCYFKENWRFTIDKADDVDEFRIDEVQVDNNQEYVFSSSMVLREEYLSYNAAAVVYYVLPDGEDWKIDMIKSLGVQVVKTGKYDDCIRCEKEPYALYITNISEVTVLVGGALFGFEEKELFSVALTPGQRYYRGCSDYRIDFVERKF